MSAQSMSNQSPTVAILLPVYNGEKFLSVQLDSLLSQSYSNFLVIARDDCSSDNSLNILNQYHSRFPDRFHIVDSESNNLGASGSFAFLIEYVLEKKAELDLTQFYLMFCDQDDRWFSEKIQTEMSAMIEAEALHENSDSPILVHSDLEVVSAAMTSIAPSLVKYQGLEIQRNRFPNLVISNLVTGCTALINESLAKRCVPLPKEAIMHDWWMALIASAFGEIVYLDETLVYYRQHENNTIGAKEFVRPPPSSLGFWQRIFSSKVNTHLVEVAIQAKRFRQQFYSQLSFRDVVALTLCSAMRIKVGFIQRLFYRIARRF